MSECYQSNCNQITEDAAHVAAKGGQDMSRDVEHWIPSTTCWVDYFKCPFPSKRVLNKKDTL